MFLSLVALPTPIFKRYDDLAKPRWGDEIQSWESGGNAWETGIKWWADGPKDMETIQKLL